MRASVLKLLWKISGVALILAGLVSFLHPDALLGAAAVLFGLVLLLTGTFDLLLYRRIQKIMAGGIWVLCEGLSNLGLSLLLIFFSDWVVLSLPLFLGAWLLICGFSRAFYALRCRGFAYFDWSWTLGCGVLLGICGLLFLLAPLAGLHAIGALMGFALFVVGALLLLTSYLSEKFWI